MRRCSFKCSTIRRTPQLFFSVVLRTSVLNEAGITASPAGNRGIFAYMEICSPHTLFYKTVKKKKNYSLRKCRPFLHPKTEPPLFCEKLLHGTCFAWAESLLPFRALCVLKSFKTHSLLCGVNSASVLKWREKIRHKKLSALLPSGNAASGRAVYSKCKSTVCQGSA